MHRCLGTEGYKHSVVLWHLARFGHTGSQHRGLAHGIHPSRMQEPTVAKKAGFHFGFIKATSKLEPAFMYICICLENISEVLSHTAKKNHCELCKKPSSSVGSLYDSFPLLTC